MYEILDLLKFQFDESYFRAMACTDRRAPGSIAWRDIKIRIPNFFIPHSNFIDGIDDIVEWPQLTVMSMSRKLKGDVLFFGFL